MGTLIRHKFFGKKNCLRSDVFTVMIVVKYGSEAWAIRKREESLDVFYRNCLWNVFGAWVSDRISNSKL